MLINTSAMRHNKDRLQTLIDQGAFGEVYRVAHLGLNATHALEVLSGTVSGMGSTEEFNECVDRYKLETQLGTRLNTPTPQIYLVMFI